MEIEVPVEQPRTFAPQIRRHHVAILELETVLMTVYYPCKIGTGNGAAPDGSKTWSRETWLPHPRVAVAGGYGHFAGIGGLAIPVAGATCMFTKLPAYRNAELSQHWPPYGNFTICGVKAKNSRGPPPPDGSYKFLPIVPMREKHVPCSPISVPAKAKTGSDAVSRRSRAASLAFHDLQSWSRRDKINVQLSMRRIRELWIRRGCR